MIGAVLRWIFPDRCALCGIVGRSVICEDCREDFKTAPPSAWSPSPLDFGGGRFLYQGRAAQAVRRLKYARSTDLARSMADDLAPLIADLAAPDGLVVPVPIHRLRRSERGFNQSELLCAGNHGREVSTTALRRIRMTPPQASLPVHARGENLHGAFEANRSIVAGRKVLLIDDVFTTGHTARACAQVLRDAGATEVGIAVFAIVER